MKEKKSVALFLIITLVLSGIVNVIWIRGGEAATVRGIAALLMWCPGIAAFIVRGRYYRKEKLLGWNRCKLSFILLAIFTPAIYLGASYGIYWLANPGAFTGTLSLPTKVAETYSEHAGSGSMVATVITWVIMIISSTFVAAGEEIGWRGFLLPQMTKIWNFKKAVIVSGLIWAVWHMPVMLAGIYNAGTPIWYQLPMFTIDILAFSVIISVLTIKSKSVWPAILIHASHNHFDQAIFGPMTDSANKAYFVGETGIITIVAIILAAVATVMLFREKAGKKAANFINNIL
jgi:uncharacterized protein